MPYSRGEVLARVSPENLFEYVVREGDSWSNIAARLLKGRGDLWWILAELNGVLDPFTELTVGRTLKVPSWDAVMFNLLNFGESPGPGGGGDAGAPAIGVRLKSKP